MSTRSSAGLMTDFVDLVELGQDRDRAGRGVDASLRFGRRHALHAMRAGLELELRIGAPADDAADDFLVPAVLALALAEHFDLPALALGVARVHPEQVARENRRLVAAGAGADFEKDIRVVAAGLSAPAAWSARTLRPRCGLRARATSSAASSLISGSPELAISCAARRSSSSRVNSRKRCATGSSREYSIDSSRNWFCARNDARDPRAMRSLPRSGRRSAPGGGGSSLSSIVRLVEPVDVGDRVE